MKRTILTFVGMPGAGKGTCTDYLERHYGWPIVHFGRMVYEEVQRRGLNNVKDEKFVREDMRQKQGPAVLAIHAAERVQTYLDDGQPIIILDGLYSWSEYKYLYNLYGEDLQVVAVLAPKRLRRERALLRKDSHRTYTIEELITREIAEIENIEKGGPIAYADYFLVNDSTPDQMLGKLEGILRYMGIPAET